MDMLLINAGRVGRLVSPCVFTLALVASIQILALCQTARAGGAPVAQLNTTSMTFGVQPAGTYSSAQSLIITNVGDAPLILTSEATVGQADDFDFSFNVCPSHIAPQASCIVLVGFSPVSAGGKAAQIKIFDNAAGSPQVVSLSGTGAGVSVSSSTIAFGTQAVGSAGAIKTVTLSNTNTADANLSSIAVVGNQADDFALSNHCGAVLRAFSSCSVSVRFWPLAIGAKTATLKFADDALGSPQVVALTGDAIASSTVVVSAPALTFASQMAKSTSTPQRLTLNNFTASPVTVNSIAITGAQADDFSQNNTCGASLAAGAACDVYVAFAPVASGAKSAVLQINESASASPLRVTLSGPATPFPSFSLAQSSNMAVQMHSADTGSLTVTAQFSVLNAPSNPLTGNLVEQLPVGSAPLVSNYSFQTPSPGTVMLTVNLKPGVDEPLGFHAENLLVSLCIDAACTLKITGSPLSLELSAEVLATEGHEYTQQRFPLNANYASWDAKLNKFCVIQGDSKPQSLALVDPDSGAVTASTTLPDVATALATSDDGQYAYIAFLGGNILRYQLPSLALDATIPLPANGVAPVLRVAPGAAHTLAVSNHNDEDDTSTVTVFDDAVARKNTMTTPSAIDLSWGDAATLYADVSDDKLELYTFDVSAAGLTQRALDTQIGDFAGGIHYAAGLLYSDTGYVFDPSQQKIVGQFSLTAGGRIVPDAELGRAFIWLAENSSLHSENLELLTEIAEAQFPGVVEAGGPLIRWGKSGLAFVTYAGDLFLIQGSFVNPSLNP